MPGLGRRTVLIGPDDPATATVMGMTGPRGPRGRYTAGRARHVQIIEAALRRFGTDGYVKTSLARVAEDVGITDAGILHHFRDKERLLLATVEYWFERLGAHWTRLPESATIREVFRAYLRDIEEISLQPGMVELVAVVGAEAINPDHPAHEIFTRWQRESVTGLAHRLDLSAELGELKPDVDHEAVARECMAMDVGARQQWLTGGRSFELVDVLRGHVDRLIRDITRDGKGL